MAATVTRTSFLNDIYAQEAAIGQQYDSKAEAKALGTGGVKALKDQQKNLDKLAKLETREVKLNQGTIKKENKSLIRINELDAEKDAAIEAGKSNTDNQIALLKASSDFFNVTHVLPNIPDGNVFGGGDFSGSAGFTDGTQADAKETAVTSIISSLPAWAWVAILGGGYFLLRGKRGKLSL